MGSMLAFAETSARFEVWPFGEVSIASVLSGAIALDGLITTLIAVLFVAARRSLRGVPDTVAPSDPLVAAQRQLRLLLIGLVVLFTAMAICYELGPLLSSSQDFFRELPFLTNSVVKMAALAMVCAYAAYRLQLNMAIVGPVVSVLALSAVLQLAYVLTLDLDGTAKLFGDLSLESFLWGSLGLDAALALLLSAAYRRAWRQRYRINFLTPASFRALRGAAGVLITDPNPAVTPDQVAQSVERFLFNFRARRRWLYGIALTAIQLAPLIELRPLLRVNPPLSELDRANRRRFLEDHHIRLPRQSRIRLIKNLKQIVIRICMQLSYAGYYGDPRTYPEVGYQPFTERPRYAELEIDEPGDHPLKVDHPDQIGVERIEADVCIVGSGAGGGILAYELAKRGRDVLVLERGEYLEPQQFNESEIEMMSHLYADGLMQQTEDWRFTVLQGSCIGGSTTVNNGVSFPPPEAVLTRWNDPQGLDAGLDLDSLGQSVAAVEEFVGVQPQAPGVQLNPSAEKFVEGAAAVGDELEVDVVRANIDGCYGSGYCNIGCRWGKKLSMLETALPRAQAEGKGDVRIISECEVERIWALSGRPEQVSEITARLGRERRRLRVQAKTYVLAAGAVGSSYLLIKNGLGRGLPVGQGFSANMGAPLTAEFPEVLNAYDGLQISHYGLPQDDGYVYETWFNPPVAQALNMPGWFEEHRTNMESYNRLMAVGVLVGTASNGLIRRAATGGPGIELTPRAEDLATLARGLKRLARILFRAEPKPERVMINAWGFEEFRDESELDRIDAICQDPDYITLGTGHPQGGNAISKSPKQGVVDPDFRVHGFENLYVCDASVFPTSLTVNPQLTVMGLAHYAAERIV
jgi:choline dehydrogenase-like flavoprotein